MNKGKEEDSRMPWRKLQEEVRLSTKLFCTPEERPKIAEICYVLRCRELPAMRQDALSITIDSSVIEQVIRVWRKDKGIVRKRNA